MYICNLLFVSPLLVCATLRSGAHPRKHEDDQDPAQDSDDIDSELIIYQLDIDLLCLQSSCYSLAGVTSLNANLYEPIQELRRDRVKKLTFWLRLFFFFPFNSLKSFSKSTFVFPLHDLQKTKRSVSCSGRLNVT